MVFLLPAAVPWRDPGRDAGLDLGGRRGVPVGDAAREVARDAARETGRDVARDGAREAVRDCGWDLAGRGSDSGLCLELEQPISPSPSNQHPPQSNRRSSIAGGVAIISCTPCCILREWLTGQTCAYRYSGTPIKTN